MKKLFTLSILLSLSAGITACNSTQSAVTDLPPGQYEHTSSKVDANGTKTTVKNQTTVAEDAYGNKSAVVEKKTTNDPKGLFNKSTTKSNTVVNEQ